jgi:hypothetical protein
MAHKLRVSRVFCLDLSPQHRVVAFAGSAAILCTGGPDVIRKEARISSGVRLCREREAPKGPEERAGDLAPGECGDP